LDSRVIENELSHLNMAQKIGSNAGGANVRDIPIFLFSLDYPIPVLIDKHYQARALSNMVIAVQSTQHLWESHLQCNNKPIYWDLRNPIKAVIQSTTTLLGGLVPHHLAYSPAHHDLTQEWLWSVGDGPFSLTSQGIEFSQIHRDALFRNYVLSILREATGNFNLAIARLKNHRTTLENRPLGGYEASEVVGFYRRKHLKDIHDIFLEVTNDIFHTTKMTEEGGFDGALDRVHTLKRRVQRFTVAVEDLLFLAEEYECASGSQQPRASQGPSWATISLVPVLLAILYSLYRLKRNKKPHIN